MAEQLMHEGKCFALLINGPDGDYIAPPIVRDPDGEVIMGREVLQAVVDSGVTIEHPLIENCDPAHLAEIEQVLALLGVPVLSL
jgi:hypothetical protein